MNYPHASPRTSSTSSLTQGFNNSNKKQGKLATVSRDNPMFTMIKFVLRHEKHYMVSFCQKKLTNEAIKDSESYKEYYAIASGAEPPKTKASVKKKQTGSDKTKTPPTTKGKRLKTSAKSICTYEGTSDKLGVPDVPTYASDDEQIFWKSSDEEDDDEVAMSNDDDHKGPDVDNEQTVSYNDGDDFVHPKLSTHDEEDKEEEDSDPRVHTPSNYESTNDEESDEEIQGANVEGEEMDEEETNEEDEANELYRDVNFNLEGRDTEMTDAPRTIV
ncbi:hypothetical protein Tco_0787638 [Tanacetum coccineum]